jgi:hypothetical protein
MDNKERRNNKRLKQGLSDFENYEVYITNTNEFFGKLVDISIDGIQIESFESIEVAEKYEVKVDVPFLYFAKRSLNLEIECRWCKKNKAQDTYFCGFSFTNTESMDKAFLGSIIDMSINRKSSIYQEE